MWGANKFKLIGAKSPFRWIIGASIYAFAYRGSRCLNAPLNIFDKLLLCE